VELETEIQNDRDAGTLSPEMDIMDPDDINGYIRKCVDRKVKADGIYPKYSMYRTAAGTITNGWSEEGIIRYNFLVKKCLLERAQEKKNSDEMVLNFYKEIREQGKTGKRKRIEVQDRSAFRKDAKAGTVKTDQFHLKVDTAKLVGKSVPEINAILSEAGMSPDDFWNSINDDGQGYADGYNESDAAESDDDEDMFQDAEAGGAAGRRRGTSPQKKASSPDALVEGG
jgi:hypothetical protein